MRKEIPILIAVMSCAFFVGCFDSPTSTTVTTDRKVDEGKINIVSGGCATDSLPGISTCAAVSVYFGTSASQIVTYSNSSLMAIGGERVQYTTSAPICKTGNYYRVITSGCQ